MFIKNHVLPLRLPVLMALILTAACHRKTNPETTTLQPPPEPDEWVDTKPAFGEPEDSSMLEYTLMDPIDITLDKPISPDTLAPYNPSHTFAHDLIHTKIEISFDWEKKRANAVATLTLKPWFYPSAQLTLDAKNFDVHSVKMGGNDLKYTYNNEELVIDLGKTFTRNDQYTIAIDYTAKPDERTSYGGSDAITSDKGLYFINPDGSDKEKPRQIWTQGETESNSFWMPTIDKPNERCTQEMYITVADNYKTLSNGLLISSKKNTDGTRTDYWKMDQPHAPYLFMMAVGEFSIVKDEWRGRPVLYYVEPKFEPYAKDIYPYTTEMLEFFSQQLGYEYPWKKFAQITVRDYVSGAMENTTSVLFGEFMQKTKRELLDDHLTNEKVVAHEMFHQWFGDLVTTESWANLTLNEGFANYSEYLWLEHKYGRDAADNHLEGEHQGYMYSASDGGHPLIHFGYDSREDMFDAHSYNKGGSILHMLRKYLGDEAFFASLQRYLKRNEYSDVEAHELRLAFEDVTGMDLNWFFNQWFFAAGHPSLDISYNWNTAASAMEVTIEQQQEAINNVPHVFQLPLTVDIYDASGTARRENIDVTKRKQTFTFKSASKPAFVNVDAEKSLLCVKTDRHTPEEWAFIFHHGPLYADRSEALHALSSDENAPMDIFLEGITDKSSDIRLFSLRSLDPTNAAAAAKVAQMAGNAKEEPAVRAAAMAFLGASGDKSYIPVLKKGLGDDEAYSVVGAALSALMSLDPDAAVEASKALEKESSDAIVGTLSELYAQHPDTAQLKWFQEKAGKVDQMLAFGFFEQYQAYLVKLGDVPAIDAGIESWKTNATTPASNSEWRRFASTKALADTRDYYKKLGNKNKATAIDAMITEIKEKETDETLKLYYSMF